MVKIELDGTQREAALSESMNSDNHSAVCSTPDRRIRGPTVSRSSFSASRRGVVAPLAASSEAGSRSLLGSGGGGSRGRGSEGSQLAFHLSVGSWILSIPREDVLLLNIHRSPIFVSLVF